jgi:carbamoyl-phosphate synthase large subunit
MATSGTADALRTSDIDVETMPKLQEARPNILDLIKDGKIALIINTPSGKLTKGDEVKIRSHAILHNVPLITTISGAQASVNGIENMIKHKKISVKPLQAYHAKLAAQGAK